MHLLIIFDLAGNVQMLAAIYWRLAASWTHVNYGEVVVVEELAQEMERVLTWQGKMPWQSCRTQSPCMKILVQAIASNWERTHS